MILKPRWDIKMIETNNRHNYSIDGEESFYVGATTILGGIDKPALVNWAAKCTADYFLKRLKQSTKWNLDLLYRRAKKDHRFIKEKAARFGSTFHSLMDTPTTEIPEGFETIMKSANLWLKNNRMKLVQGDTMVVSKKYGYGGSFDAIYQDEKGKLVLIDFKSGKSIFESYGAQVAAYIRASLEVFNLSDLPRGLVVRFSKDSVEYEEREVLDVNTAFDFFKAALDLYKASQFNLLSKPNKVKENNNGKSTRLRKQPTEVR